jgi:hypothetical protein
MKPVPHVGLSRALLFLPFVVPLLTLGLLVVSKSDSALLSVLAAISVASGVAIRYGAVAYVIFTVLAWKWMKGRTPREISIFGLVAPLLFFPLQVVVMQVVRLLGNTSIRLWFGGFSVTDCFRLSFLALLVNYSYVLLAFIFSGIVAYFWEKGM